MLVVSLTHYRTANKVHTSLWENAALNTEMSQEETGFLLYRRKRILVGSVLAENYKRLSTLCYCNFFCNNFIYLLLRRRRRCQLFSTRLDM